MARTLLITHPGASWRSWLKDNRGDRDLIILDPAEPSQGTLARLSWFHGEKTAAWRFYGSLDAQRAPHVLLAALAQMLEQAGDNALVQLFPVRGGPLMRQVVALLAQLTRPESILVAEGTDLDLNGFPVGPESIELEAAFPETVQHAQRKAIWLKLLERCVEHDVDLRRVALEGSRLGSGQAIGRDALQRLHLETVLHAEISGGTLMLVAEEEPDENTIARALDVFHCSRAHFVAPAQYAGLLCSFARQDGEDFGMGLVSSIDFLSGTARILSDAVPPAPVRILRLGTMRIDSSGRELGEARPWQV
jgi:polynucleotide 5'-kinase involved in rRNA processing